MPSEEAHHVLPLDFLIWAITYNWQIITHKQVESLLSQHKRYLELRPPVNSRAAELHDAMVEDIQEKQKLIQIFRQIDQIVADRVQKNKGVVLPPRLWKASSIKLDPISVEMIILAGDNYYRCLTGCEPPDVNTPSEAEDKASVFSALDTQEVKKLSWLMDKTAAGKKTAASDPELILSKQAIKTAEVLLADFDLALQEAITHLSTQSDTSDTVPLQQSVKTTDINEPLEVLWSIAGFFARGKDKEDIEKRWSSVNENLIVLGKQIPDELQGLDKVSESNARESEQLAQSSKAYMARVARYHAYACAYDFLMICRVLARLDELLADSSFTLSDLYGYNPQAFLKFLTIMNTPQRMRYITLVYIDNLPLSIKQYWDNV
jgi:hypothetical protein